VASKVRGSNTTTGAQELPGRLLGEVSGRHALSRQPADQIGQQVHVINDGVERVPPGGQVMA
jgi:hypothetical protein